MNPINYIKDKIVYIFSYIIGITVTISILAILQINKLIIILITILLITSMIIPLIYEYIKKYTFYKTFKSTLDKLDRKYLITEMIKQSNFTEGQLLLNYLYDIDKSMHENVNNYKYTSQELREYIELWCHEIKTPIATSKLIVENNNNKITKSILEEIENIETYVEQILFYARSNTVEKDYIITDTDLKKIVKDIIKNNKKTLISKKIKIEIGEMYKVKSDSKWLEFIINQIINNSIKYSKKKNAYIKISAEKYKNNITLSIKDNGIGIEETEINKVFDKGFTGTNGRKKYNSTGIGLYLCKKLCNKLNHKITIDSKLNKYTIIRIIFPNSSMTNIQ